MELHIDLNAIRSNILKIKEQTSAKLTLMVKANAYNHGVDMVAKVTEDLIDKFGVATADEGAELRKLGVSKEIIVTAFCSDELQKVVFYNLTPIIGDFESLNKIVSLKLSIPFDIKIDTGMNRLGFKGKEEINKVIALIKNYRLNLRGICTHFYGGDIKEIETQEKLFLSYKSFFNKNNLYPVCHLANSAGFLNKKFYDEIRIGILAYGYGAEGYRRALTVKDRIEKIKYLQKGEKLGYGGLFIAKKNVKIGIIRCGYYDGIVRSYRNSEVIVNNKKEKIIGNVCMDICFVEIDAKDNIGDEVILFPVGEEKEIEKKHKTIIYELITNFKGRNKRIYYL